MSLSCLMPLKKRPFYVFSAHDGSDKWPWWAMELWNDGMCVVVISTSQLCSSVSWLQMALISETSEQRGDNGDKLRRPECDNENNVSDAAEMTPHHRQSPGPCYVETVQIIWGQFWYLDIYLPIQYLDICIFCFEILDLDGFPGYGVCQCLFYQPAPKLIEEREIIISLWG